MLQFLHVEIVLDNYGNTQKASYDKQTNNFSVTEYNRFMFKMS